MEKYKRARRDLNAGPLLLGITIAGLPGLRDVLGFVGQAANAAKPVLGFVMERPPS